MNLSTYVVDVEIHLLPFIIREKSLLGFVKLTWLQ